MKHRPALLLGSSLVLGFAGIAWTFQPAPPPVAPLEEGHTLTVAATGAASAPVTRYELTIRVEAKEEVAADAIQSFRQARQRADAALDSAGVEGLAVAGGGMKMSYGPDTGEMNQNVFFMGGEMEVPDNFVHCKESLRVSFPATGDADQSDRVAAVIDTALDAELGLGGTVDAMAAMGYISHTSFGGDDEPETMLAGRLEEEAELALESDAQRAAFERAQRLAQSLAERAGRQLGAASSISVESTSWSWEGITAERKVEARVRVTFTLQ